MSGAADGLADLRDELWRAVDAKVAAVQAIDARHLAQRPQWLAAAQTVTTGGGDLAAASELVDQQVKPFVVGDIGTDWVGAMRRAATSVGAAYDAAISRIATNSRAVFDIPGALGPRADPRARPQSDGDAYPAAATNPAAASPTATVAPFNPMVTPGGGSGWSGPAAMPSAVMPAAAMPAAAVPPAAMQPADPAGSLTAPGGASPAASMGDLAGAAPAGASGFGQQLADLIGGLLGSFGGADDPAGSDAALDDSLDDPDPVDKPTDEDLDDPENLESGSDEPDDDSDEPDDDSEAEPVDEVVDEPVDQPAEPIPVAPTPTEPILPESPPPPLPLTDPPLDPPAEPTPCEIAADELPQVGE